jgi:hypothetical protein
MENHADQLSERFLVFASNIIKLVKRIDSNQFHRHIGMQLFRSATAIGANSYGSGDINGQSVVPTIIMRKP